MMKISFLAILLLNYACVHTPAQDTSDQRLVEVSGAVTTKEPALDFEKDIKPILQSHCMPCHFTGGKMYGKMPFDQPKTLIDFQVGILRRMKDETEATTIRNFLAQTK